MFNKHNRGSGFSINQAINQRERLRIAWKEYRDSYPGGELSVKAAGGNAAYAQHQRSWLRGNSGCKAFGAKWPLYECVCGFIGAVQELEWFDELKEWINDNTDNIEASSSESRIEDILKNCAEQLKTINNHYKHTLPPARFKSLFFECMAAAIPTDLLGAKECFGFRVSADVISRLHCRVLGGKSVEFKLSANKAKRMGNPAKKAAPKSTKNDSKNKRGKDTANAAEQQAEPPKKKRLPADVEAEPQTGMAIDAEVADDVEQEQLRMGLARWKTQLREEGENSCIKQNMDLLKSSEWADDMNWIMEQAVRCYVANGSTLEKDLPAEASMVWKQFAFIATLELTSALAH